MTLTTPQRPHDILKAVPALAEHARPVTRLHPREGAPDIGQSSVGGPLLWPVDEPWPVCRLEHDDFFVEPFDPALNARYSMLKNDPSTGKALSDLLDELARGANADFDPDAPPPLIPVAQLYYRDVPGLPWPEKYDLLQILWCPRNHTGTETDTSYCPAFQVAWRRAENIHEVLKEVPQPDLGQKRYVPNPCIVHPEVVTEYPNIHVLPQDLQVDLDVWEAATSDGANYSSDIANAPGWKVMGHGMSWGIYDPYPMTCECGAEQLPLFTADFSEHGRDTKQYWQPVEEAATGCDLANPTGVTIGRGYALQLYYCPVSEHHASRSEMA
ncbi:hypothetical protein [Glycomyces tritici]|uniref:DUF1963 domain-containing protein n=1 Tax=Glycomyces tritici TaxID=2665176 RepID=A0ABT7YM15_9ACTN|nr:hypothetical protein [Glycomyces tritici]MDN3239682.1 hypothetical protein [Glycomyces tritici]